MGASDLTFVAFDLETTGLDPERDDITEVAGVRFNLEGEELGSFEQLAKPACPIPKIVSKKTGITQEMVDDAPPSWAVVQAFTEWVGDDAVLVAHNASFDCRFLLSAFERNGASPPSWQVADSRPLVKRLNLPPGSSRSLKAILEHLGEDTSGLHRAKPDAYGARAVILASLATYKNPRAAIKRRLGDFIEVARPTATPRQLDYLRDLGAEEAGLILEGLTRAEASKMIDYYQEQQQAAQRRRAEVVQPQGQGCLSALALPVLISLAAGIAAFLAF